MNTKLLAWGTLTIVSVTAISMARPGDGAFSGRPDPEDIVAEIVATYDVNTDNLITSEELASAIVGMHEKRIEHMEALADKRGSHTDRERPGGPRGKRERPEPSEIAAKLLSDFDADADDALDTEELMGALDALHSNGPRGKRGPGPRGMGGPRGGRHSDEDV